MSNRRRFIQTLGALAPALAFGPAWANADPSRQALVIGNGAYADAPLANPVNDAKAVTGLLGQAGFTVSSHLNATRVDLLAAIERFATEVRKSDTKQVMLYFAGHGVQLDWRNYLLPVDAKAQNAEQLRQSCVDLNQLIGELGKSKGKTFIIMLDACRNNPFGSAYRPQQPGLSQFDAPVGSLLAYATSPGNVASDGAGQNGLYTENLLRELSVRNTRIEDALKRVRLNVRLASNGAQIPWESTSLEEDVFIFRDGQRKLSEAEQEKLLEEDLAEWGRIKNSGKTDDYVGYLRKFPNGRFTEIVQVRLARLLAEREQSRMAEAEKARLLADAEKARLLAAAENHRPQQDRLASSISGPQIELGPNLPVPVFMEPTNNPYSAGRYPLGRKFSVGDTFTRRDLDLLTRVEQRIRTSKVTNVDVAGDRVEFDSGGITDLMGNLLRFGQVSFEAPLQENPSELQIGKKWRCIGRSNERGVVSDFYYDYEIVRREAIVVPAGRFDTFVVDGKGWNKTFGTQLNITTWLVPGLNSAVCRESVFRNSRGNIIRSDRMELVRLTQNGIDQQCAAPAGNSAQRNLVIKNNCS